MKVKAAELQGAALDWAVAECEFSLRQANGERIKSWVLDRHRAARPEDTEPFSSDWLLGSPIIERERIGVCFYSEADGWTVPGWAAWRTDIDDRQMISADTPLVAAMRCYVASKMGDEVDIPEERLHG